jgi:hypothetical protein
MPKPKHQKTRKAGRPPLPKGNAREGTLRVRVTPDELRQFELAAKASRHSVSKWIREGLNTMRFIEVGPKGEALDARTQAIINDWKADGWTVFDTVEIGDGRRHVRFQRQP